jgi:SNF2 family DNA or RNA helicase
MRYQILSNDLVGELSQMPREQQEMYLFLEPSAEFRGRWQVDGLWPSWFLEFEILVRSYCTISPARLGEFLTRADELDYTVVFNEPPEDILSAYESLSEPPPFEIHSSLDNTTNGFLPWQIVGFNKLVRDETLRGGLAIWSTGTGKTVLIASAILWHTEYGHPYDLALVVAKLNNKADMNRKLKRLADIDSIIIDGKPERRMRLYEEIEERLASGEKVVAVTNYEKIREDPLAFKTLLKKRDVLAFWDEIPTRLSTRETKMYKAVKKVLWKRFESRKEGLEGALTVPSWLRQWGLSATPIKRDPDGAFSYIRLMDPPLLGKVEEFHSEYVVKRNFFSKAPEKWGHLDKMGATIEHMVHRVDRDNDPEVAAMFPKVILDPLVIDWHPKDRSIYDVLTGKAEKIIEEDFSEANILAMIQVMQMLCDAPSMLVQSMENRGIFEEFQTEFPELQYHGPKGSEIAQMLLLALKGKPTDDHHTKLETWREIIQEKHPNDKILTFMTWSAYGFKPLTAKLDEWDVSYVTYEGTAKQATAAKDLFREDPDIQVFLSSDRGSDSIDIPEAAVGVNYNLPWSWDTTQQRMRNVRVDSDLETNYWYDLIMADSIEERKQQIIETKRGYHAALFDGGAADEALSAKLTREDLLHILLGKHFEGSG